VSFKVIHIASLYICDFSYSNTAVVNISTDRERRAVPLRQPSLLLVYIIRSRIFCDIVHRHINFIPNPNHDRDLGLELAIDIYISGMRTFSISGLRQEVTTICGALVCLRTGAIAAGINSVNYSPSIIPA